MSFFKNVVRQHNDLAPAAIEQQITNHYSSRLWHDSSFKKCCASAQRLLQQIKNVVPEAQHLLLAPAALEQQVNFLFLFKTVVRQHNDLVSVVIEQQINNLIIHQAYRIIVHFKNVVNTLLKNVARQRNILSSSPCGA